MKTKTMVGIAVASALSWSYGAMAGNYGHMGGDSTYGVVTPFSPNESGPADLPYGNRYASLGAGPMSAGIPSDHEARTPLASNESGVNSMNDSDMKRGRSHSMARMHSRHHGMSERTHSSYGTERVSRTYDAARVSSSLPNPQTPWSPSEAGLNTYAEDMQHYRQQVAEVEQARIAAAEWNARIASAPPTDNNRTGSSAGLAEPTGGTSGMGMHGSTGAYVAPAPQSPLSEPPTASDFRTDAADMPGETERTSAMRSEEYPVAVTEYSAVGILETPSTPSDTTVWSVEPLTPNADLTAGDTVYIIPEGAEVAVFVPQFDNSSQLGTSGEYSASTSESGDSSMGIDTGTTGSPTL